MAIYYLGPDLGGVGGGGGSYGGGGGGAASDTHGAAGGAGYFGGGGAEINLAGGGGGYTGGSAGGNDGKSFAGTASTGGNGYGQVLFGGSFPPAMTLGGKLGSLTVNAISGSLTTTIQGGQGVSPLSNFLYGQNIPLTSGAANITIAGGAGGVRGLGDVVGGSVVINSQTGLVLGGTVVGTTSVTLTSTGQIYQVPQTSSSLIVSTPSLSILAGGLGVGQTSTPLRTDAAIVTLNNVAGSSPSYYVTDTGYPSVTVNAGGVTSATSFNLVGTNNFSSLDVTLPAAIISSLVVNAAGSLNFENSAIRVGSSTIGGSVAITAGSSLSWTDSTTTNFSLNVDSSDGSGGNISVTAVQVNGSSNVALGLGSGQIALSAQGGGASDVVSGGSLQISFRGASLTVDPLALNVGFNGSTVNGNGGSIAIAAGTIAGVSPTAPLIITAIGIGTGSGGKISLATSTANTQTIGVSGGQIELQATNGLSAVSGQTGGSVSFINAGTGLLSVDAGGLVVAANTGAALNGGSILLSSGSVANLASGPLVLNVDGLGGGNGGSISVSETTAVNAKLGMSGDFYFSARGGASSSIAGDGGNVTFSTLGNLTLTTSGGDVLGTATASNSASVGPLGSNGKGGTLNLTANTFASSESENLTFIATGVGSGGGGAVALAQLATNQPLTIGKGPGQVQFEVSNGVTGVVGGNVSVTLANPQFLSQAVLTVDPSAIVQMSSSSANPNVSGGILQLVAPVIKSAIVSKTALTLELSGIGSGKGGEILFHETKSSTVLDVGTKSGQFAFNVSGGKNGGSAGGVDVLAEGDLTVTPAAIIAKASGDGDGASITLTALSADVSLTGNLLVTGSLSANAAGKGVGGTISLDSDSSSTNVFNVGLVTNNINGVKGGLSVAGGTGGAVNINIENAGILVIQSTLTSAAKISLTTEAINLPFVGSADNSEVSIKSTVGGTKTTAITIVGGQIIDGSTAGKLVTSTTSSLPGLITLTALGGGVSGNPGKPGLTQFDVVTTNISATCSLNGISISDAIPAADTVMIIGLHGGSVSFTTTGSIMAPAGAAGPVITANENISLVASGFIKASAVADSVAVTVKNTTLASEIFAQADSFSGAGKTGSFTAAIEDATGVAANYDFSLSKGVIGLLADQNLTLTGTIGNTSSALTVGSISSPISIVGTAIFAGTSVLFSTAGGDLGSNVNSIQTNTTNLSFDNTGHTFINNVNKSVLSIGADSQVGTLALVTAGGLKTTSISASLGDLSVTSSGASTVTGLSAINTLTVTDKSGTLAFSDPIGSFGSIDVIGIGSGAVNVGDVNNVGDISVTGGGITTAKGLSSAGSIFVFGDGATTVGNLAVTGASGDISVSDKTGLLQTAVGAQIYAQNGAITFNNQNARSGAITVGASTDIETGAKPVAGGIGGDVIIAVGALPNVPVTPGITGTEPASTLATVSAPNNGVLAFNGGITAVNSKATGINTITADGAAVVFSTGTLRATAIRLNGGTTIIADPPVTGASASSMAGSVNPALVNPALLSTSPEVRSISVSGSSIVSEKNSLSSWNGSPFSSGALVSSSLFSPSSSEAETATFSSLSDAGLLGVLNSSFGMPTSQIGNYRQTPWISETEIESGAIPAFLSTDRDLQIYPELSMAVDLVDLSAEARFVDKTTRLPMVVGSAGSLAGGVRFDKTVAAKYALDRGSVIFANTKSTEVKTPFGTVSIAANALVLVMALKTGLAVYDFHDSHAGAVVVYSGGKKYDLNPGKHLLITRDGGKGFENVNPAQLFAYRSVLPLGNIANDADQVLSVFTADFQLDQALRIVSPFRQLISSDNLQARKIASGLLKTVGIMASLDGNNQSYTQLLRSR